MTTVYRVTHRTAYRYEQPVSASYGQLHMLPRELPCQRCVQAGVTVEPVPELYRERLDYFGNRVGYFALHEPHERLTVTVTSVVEVEERLLEVSLFGSQPWEVVRDAARDGAAGVEFDIAQYVLDSPLIATGDQHRRYAEASFTAGGSVFEAVSSLCSRIHEDFEYAPGTTSVATPLAEVVAERHGVCQDFAHVGIACLRSLGLPARYVSGYIETDPPPGSPKLIGADGSHAWLSVFIPDAGWVDVDPTNDQFVGGRYVVTAIGRDYSDVPPMNGVIYTEGRTEELDVSVDVVVLSGR